MYRDVKKLPENIDEMVHLPRLMLKTSIQIFHMI